MDIGIEKKAACDRDESPSKKQRVESDRESDEESAQESERKPPALPVENLSYKPCDWTYEVVNVDEMEFTKDGRDDGAFRYFKEHVKTRFICGTQIPEDLPPKERPSVEHFQVDSLKVNGLTPELIIVRNAFFRSFVEALTGIYYEPVLPFCRDDGKHFRCFVTDAARNAMAKASFQMGKDAAARFIRAFNAHELERVLIKIVEAHVRAAMKAKYGVDFDVFLNQGGVNAVLLDIRNAFAEHFDHDVYNTVLETVDSGLEKDYRGGEHQAPLPEPGRMIIATIVLSGPLGSVKPGDTNYELNWKIAETGANVISAKTGHNEIHIQIGLDADCVHSGAALKISFCENSWRITITLRGYCNPTVNLPAWQARSAISRYDYDKPLIGEDAKDLIFGVLKMFENPQLESVSALAKLGEPTITAEKDKKKKLAREKKPSVKLPQNLLLTHPANHDIYPSCPANEMPAENISHLVQLQPIMQHRQPIIELYFSWMMQQLFLRNRLFLRALIYNHDSNDPAMKDKPRVLNAFPVMVSGSGQLFLPKPMHYYPKSTMQDMGHLNWSNRTKTITSTDQKIGPTLVCVTSIDRVDRNNMRDFLLGNTDHCRIYGSGGAAHAPGQAGPTMTKGITVESEPWAYCSSPQETHTNKINRVLSRAAENTQPVDLWMGVELAGELAGNKIKPSGSENVLHVARMILYGEETVEGEASMEQLLDGFPELTLEQKARAHPHSSFRHRSYKIYKLRRINEDLFKNFEDFKVYAITDREGEFARFCLPDNDRNLNQHVGVRLDIPGGAIALQACYHFEQHVANLEPNLLTVGNHPIITETDPSQRADSRPWTLYRNQLRKANPFAKQLDGTTRPKKVAIVEFRTLMVAMVYVGFARMLGKSVTESKKSVPLQDKRVGTVLRKSSFPIPIRTYDPPVLLYLQHSSRSLENGISETGRNMADDIYASLVSHLFSRPCGFGNYFNSLNPEQQSKCLMMDNVDLLIDHMRKAVTDSRVSIARYSVKQYQKQIPVPLRTSVEAIALFLKQFTRKAQHVVDTVLSPGRTRREYVIGLARVLSSIQAGVGAPKFYFIAQHIISTLAESYEEGRFGDITLDDVHMGPGSKKAISALGFQRNRPKAHKTDSFDAMSNYLHQEEADIIMRRLSELTDEELAVMGLYRSKKDKDIRVLLIQRKVSYIDIEHMLCKLYLFFNKKSPPGMQALQPNYDQPHCHPAKYNAASLNPLLVKGIDTTVQNIAEKSMAAFDKIDFHMPWKMLFSKEWPRTPEEMDFDVVPLVDPLLPVPAKKTKKGRKAQSKKARGEEDDDDEDYDPDESSSFEAREEDDKTGIHGLSTGKDPHENDYYNDNNDDDDSESQSGVADDDDSIGHNI